MSNEAVRMKRDGEYVPDETVDRTEPTLEEAYEALAAERDKLNTELFELGRQRMTLAEQLDKVTARSDLLTRAMESIKAYLRESQKEEESR